MKQKALAGFDLIGHPEIHIQSELDNPSYAARKFENSLEPRTQQAGMPVFYVG